MKILCYFNKEAAFYSALWQSAYYISFLNFCKYLEFQKTRKEREEIALWGSYAARNEWRRRKETRDLALRSWHAVGLQVNLGKGLLQRTLQQLLLWTLVSKVTGCRTKERRRGTLAMKNADEIQRRSEIQNPVLAVCTMESRKTPVSVIFCRRPYNILHPQDASNILNVGSSFLYLCSCARISRD